MGLDFSIESDLQILAVNPQSKTLQDYARKLEICPSVPGPH